MLHSKLNVYRTGWLELVFANRNQTYGAFELRKNYEKTLAKALFMASVFFVGAVCSPLIYSKFIDKPSADLSRVENPRETVVDLSKIPQDKPVELPAEAEPIQQPASLAKSTAPSTRFTEMRVVSENQVTEEVPTIQELQNTVISNVSQTGSGTAENVLPNEGINGNGSGGNEGTADSNEPVSLASIEKYPEFPGGMDAFANFLRKHLRYPSNAVENGIQGRVTLTFVVERDGSLTDIKVLRGIGFGCDEEAVRVLKKSPQWAAGVQNERKVRVQYTMPIVFQMN